LLGNQASIASSDSQQQFYQKPAEVNIVDVLFLDIPQSSYIIQQSGGKISTVISRTMIYACVVTTIKILTSGLI